MFVASGIGLKCSDSPWIRLGVATDCPPRSIQSSSGIGVIVASPAGLSGNLWRWACPLAAGSGRSSAPCCCAHAATAMRETEIRTRTRFMHPPLSRLRRRNSARALPQRMGSQVPDSIERMYGRGSGINPFDHRRHGEKLSRGLVLDPAAGRYGVIAFMYTFWSAMPRAKITSPLLDLAAAIAASVNPPPGTSDHPLHFAPSKVAR